MSSTAIPRPEHPRPDFLRSDWLSLNGPWEFEADPGLSGEARGLVGAKRFKEEILVPFCPESPLSGVGRLDFMDAVWYRKRLRLPKAWAGRRVLLHFGAVDYAATVWVNGREVGRHRGGYTPFVIDITDAISSGINAITLRAVDQVRTRLQPAGKQSPRYSSFECMYRRTTGIWQSVWLEAVGEAYLERLRVTPDLDSGHLWVQAEVAGPASLLRAVVRDGRHVVATAEAPAAWRQAQLSLCVPEPRAWAPAHPHLYDLELTLLRAGAVVDRVSTYFGFRKLHIEGNKIYLNDRVLFQRLVLDQGFYPEGIYTAPTERALRRDIELAKAMGFDGARLHQKVFEPRFLYWADRLGYLCWGEAPDWGLDMASAEALENHLAGWIEAVIRDRNHPSIIGWCPTNETPESQRRSAIELLYHATRAIDPSRPIIDTSGYTHVLTDVDDNHDYTQDPAAFHARQAPVIHGAPFRNHATDAPYRGQPFLCSEYGGIWWNPGQKDKAGWGYGDRPRSEHEFLARLRALTDTLLRNPAMCGLCYTQLTDVEQEVNGLYTFARKPKFDPAVVAGIFRQPAAIEE